MESLLLNTGEATPGLLHAVLSSIVQNTWRFHTGKRPEKNHRD